MLEQVLRNDAHWECLPTVALVSIYQYLPYRERFQASQVCRNWSLAFDSPTLWKKMSFVFDGDMVGDTRKALLFAKKHSTAVRHLSLTFRRNTGARMKEILENLRLFFEYLFSSMLFTFELDSFAQFTESNLVVTRKVTGVVDAFKAFMKAQRNLQKVTLTSSHFCEKDGMDVLTGMATNNLHLLELRLIDAFEETVDVWNNLLFQNSLKMLNNLEKLAVSYQCISTEILELLCLNEPRMLRKLLVICNYKGNLRHTIPNETWRKFRRSYPDIVIAFDIIQLRLDFGFVSIPSLEHTILNLVRNCKLLKNIFLAGVLRIWVAVRVCEIALQSESEVQDVHLVFFFTNIGSLGIMVLLQQYRQQLKAKGVNFKFNLLNSQLPQ